MKAKICGITRETDRRVACEAGADAIGLISGVPVETPREISLDHAAELADATPPFVTAVLVTMPDTAEQALDRIARVEPDAIQFHGVSPDLVETVSREASIDVLAAVDPTDDDLSAFAAVADALVVDSVDEQGGGGTGETHDWARTRELVAELDAPIVLAGGLTPENVTEAIETVDPYGVDTASGVEQDGGIKDHDAVERFVARAKGTQHSEEVPA